MRNYLSLFLLSSLLFVLHLDSKAEWQQREIPPTAQQVEPKTERSARARQARHPEKQERFSDVLSAILLITAVGGLLFGMVTPFIFASSGLALWSTVSLLTSLGTLLLFVLGGLASLPAAQDPQGALAFGIALLFAAFTLFLHGLILLVVGLLQAYSLFILVGGIGLGLACIGLLIVLLTTA